MNRLPTLEALVRLYDERGDAAYGEGVSQREHALQCAVLAKQQGSPPNLIVAALLHDVGHLFEDEALVTKSDGRHEIRGAQALRPLFGYEVRAPIALHVAAKRYLCFSDPAYADSLSEASTASLALQGGPFTSVQAEAFERKAHWRQAVALRRFDDLGKQVGLAGASFADFLPLLRDAHEKHKLGA